jgi:hypothetical protein
MLTSRLRLLVVCCCGIIFGLAWLARAEAQVAEQTTLPKTQKPVVGPGEVQANIDLWVKAQSELLRISFQKDVTVQVEQSASDYLAKEYVDRTLAPAFFENRELSHFVVKMDQFTVLNRSFEEAVRSQYKTLFQFLQSERPAIAIRVPDIKSAFQDEDCSIIPCPPDRCKPDCSPKAFARFAEAPGLYPCAIVPR